jgi:HSP20 family molecular chaperone IbpA
MGHSVFTRTVWLPHPVNGNNVVAKLEDGVLHLTIPKTEEKETLKVPIE